MTKLKTEKASATVSKPATTGSRLRKAPPALARPLRGEVNTTPATPTLPSTAPSARPAENKRDLVIGLLKRPEGATIDELTAATGWQKHSVRGLISGGLKKKLQLTVVSERAEGRRTYRIADSSAAA